MKLTKFLLTNLICGLLAMCIACSKVDEDPHTPVFNLELTSELFFNYESRLHDAVSVAICVSEEDMFYLERPYILTVENLSGGDISLIEEADYQSGIFTKIEELDSQNSDLGVVNKFHDGLMIDNNYYAFAQVPLVCSRRRDSFRLKLYFYETSEIYYTPAYTIVKLTHNDPWSVYWIMPGEYKSN